MLEVVTEEAHPPETAAHAPVAEVSREIVRIFARFYGRGPTKARTIFHNNVIVVVLEEVFTKPEEVLVHANQFDQVRAQRQAIQDEIEPLFRQVVEAVTGREVRAFLSQVNEEGVAAEVFVLVPDSEPPV